MTAITPARVLAQLAVIQREITDPYFNRAVGSYDNVPYTISTADMPLFVNLVGPLNAVSPVGADEKGREFNEIRNFTMNLYHSPVGSGVEGEKWGLITPYFDLVYAKFFSYPHLKQLDGTLDSRLVGDSGMTLIPFNGQNYFGVRFTLQVTSKVRRLLSNYE